MHVCLCVIRLCPLETKKHRVSQNKYTLQVCKINRQIDLMKNNDVSNKKRRTKM